MIKIMFYLLLWLLLGVLQRVPSIEKAPAKQTMKRFFFAGDFTMSEGDGIGSGDGNASALDAAFNQELNTICIKHLRRKKIVGPKNSYTANFAKGWNQFLDDYAAGKLDANFSENFPGVKLIH